MKMSEIGMKMSEIIYIGQETHMQWVNHTPKCKGFCL